MFELGRIVWIIFQLLIGFNLVLPFLLYLLYQLAGKKDQPPLHSDQSTADYAVIVTAYEQTALLPAVVASLLKLDYENYLIYIVADNCDVSALSFEDPRVIILRPPEILASNVKSHFYAIGHFRRNHERLTIIDSDNLVTPGYLNELNKYFDAGFIAVQGQRNAKNLDTTYACLDAARDIYYHFYDGLVLFNIGSSATLAGSGMAFTVKLYRECLEHLQIRGAGFDKVLQASVVTLGHRIAYAPKAIVYDEKTSRPEQLIKQRARWINTWFRYFTFGFALLAKGLIRFNRNQLLFGLVLLRPPLFIFLTLSVMCIGINVVFSPIIAAVWMLGLAFFLTAFYIALTASRIDARIYRSLKSVPKFIFYQLLSLLKARKANTHSVSTQHYHDNHTSL